MPSLLWGPDMAEEMLLLVAKVCVRLARSTTEVEHQTLTLKVIIIDRSSRSCRRTAKSPKELAMMPRL